jgi:hypothetical protein
MKYIIALILLCSGCSTTPAYRSYDCTIFLPYNGRVYLKVDAPSLESAEKTAKKVLRNLVEYKPYSDTGGSRCEPNEER